MVTSVSADLCGGVCTGSYDGKVMRWDVSTGQCVATFEAPSKTPSSVVTAVACVGPFLLASYRDKKVKKLLLRTGECLYIIDKAHTCSVCVRGERAYRICGRYTALCGPHSTEGYHLVGAGGADDAIGQQRLARA